MRIGQVANWDDGTFLAKFRRLWADKTLSTAEIGRRLGVSKSAVCGKAGRLNLPRRDSPIKERNLDSVLHRRPGGAGRYRERMKAAALPLLTSEQSEVADIPDATPKPVMVKPKPIVAAPVFIGRVSECCWPTSEGRPWRFCGAPTIPGKDYCADHHKTGFIKPPRHRHPSPYAA